MNRFWKTLAVLAFAVVLATSSFAQILPPQGRLTLQTGTPVMYSDVVGATTIYYTPYVGNSLIVSDGTSLSNQTFSELSLNVANTTVSGELADVYAISVSGAFQLCIRTGWSGNARGSGFGLTMLQGILVNANTLTSNCGTPTTNYTVPAKEGIYLGTIYTSAHPGSTTEGLTVQFNPTPALGGTGNLIGIWNAYNRVPFHSLNRDSTTSWTSTPTAGWSAADGSENTNQITWVDGNQEVQTKARFALLGATNVNVSALFAGMLLDNTSGTPDLASAQTFGTAANWNVCMNVEESFPPQLGLNYVQAMDKVTGTSATATFYGSGYETFILDGEY